MLRYLCNCIWLLHVVVVLAAFHEEVSGGDTVSDAVVSRACGRALDAQEAGIQALEGQAARQIQETAIFPLWLQPVKKASPDDKSFSAGAYEPQQDRLRIMLMATYFYTCGRTGTHSRRFSWEAVYGNDNELRLNAIQNINGFFNVQPNVPEPGDFRAVFHGHWHVGYAEMCCRYTATGHIEGTLYQDLIGMDLVTMSGPVQRRPRVSESCSIGRRTMVRVPHPCIITYVHVEQG